MSRWIERVAREVRGWCDMMMLLSTRENLKEGMERGGGEGGLTRC